MLDVQSLAQIRVATCAAVIDRVRNRKNRERETKRERESARSALILSQKEKSNSEIKVDLMSLASQR